MHSASSLEAGIAKKLLRLERYYQKAIDNNINKRPPRSVRASFQPRTCSPLCPIRMVTYSFDAAGEHERGLKYALAARLNAFFKEEPEMALSVRSHYVNPM